jgi:tetratricopeptide (TPR) repeat protein
MGFRDSFIDGYLLTPVGPRQRTFAQWSLENTVDSGLRANQKQVQALGKNLTSVFEAGIFRLEQSQMQSAKLLQRELQYQADSIVYAIERSSADVVGAVQKACDYLGGQLCEVRWAVERQNEISQRILLVLLNALDNTSRQYWEQGVKCYETAEYELARERFNRALDANRTNYFAYQYLGFIAVHEEKSSEALKNFELARKFADCGYHRALALSHLARSHYATGDLPHAIQAAVSSVEAAPDHAKFWYECAVFHVRGSNVQEAIQCLRRAISTDWTYWSISISDANVDPIRPRVERLLEQMREEQRLIARQALDRLGSTMKRLQGMQITTEVAESRKKLDEFEAKYREGTVFAYRSLI